MSLRDLLQDVYDRHGVLTPETVVEEARPEDSPLHGYVFDRGPAEAAEAWFRHRAHDLITSVKIRYRTPEHKGGDRSVRAFHAVRREDGGYVYEPAEKVARDPGTKQLVLQEMERDWKQLQRRAEEFEVYAEFVAMVQLDVATEGEAA